MTPAMHLSFSEVQDLCTKAARGAGLSWGIAEEAGYAAQWLFVRGLDGPTCLLAHLEAGGATWPGVPLQGGAIALASGEALCPLRVGTALSDATSQPCEVLTGPVHQPLMLLPFLHMMSDGLKKDALLTWGEGRAAVSSGGRIMGDVMPLAAMDKAEVTVSFSDVRLAEFDAAVPSLGPETISALNNFAMETTVPATEASRADAGSSDRDND